MGVRRSMAINIKENCRKESHKREVVVEEKDILKCKRRLEREPVEK